MTDHRCAPGAPACAEPTPSRWEVADIVRLYGDSYRQTHPVSPGQQRVLEAIAACRTAQLGPKPTLMSPAANWPAVAVTGVSAK